MPRSGVLASALPLVAVALAILLSAPACDDGGAARPTTPAPDRTAGIDRIEIVSEPAANGTYLAGEEIVFAVFLTSGLTVEAVGSAFLTFELGRARQPAELVRTDGEYLEFRYRIRCDDHDGDGLGVPEGEIAFTRGGGLSVGGVPVDPRVPELPPDEAHRVFARHLPGDSVVFDDGLEFVADPPEGIPVAGCATVADAAPLVEAVLDGDPVRAATLFAAARQSGRCAELPVGEAAIFLSAGIREYRGRTYDLVLAYGPGDTVRGRTSANWWTLGDYLAPAPGSCGARSPAQYIGPPRSAGKP